MDKGKWLHAAMATVHKQGTHALHEQDVFYLFAQECAKETNLTCGRQLHCLMVIAGVNFVAGLGDHLVHLFVACESLLEASLVFCNLAKPSTSSWHAIISAHARHGESDRVLQLHHQMQGEGIQPIKRTYLCILKACGAIRALHQGKLIHDEIVQNNLKSDVVLGSTLIDMYAKCGDLDKAGELLYKLPNRNVVSWGAMIAGCAQHGHGLLALELFERMQQELIHPDEVIFACLLKACGSIKALDKGELIHGNLITYGHDTGLVIRSTLVDMYAKCGSLVEAHTVFDQSSDRNVVMWGAMIAGHVQHGHGAPALELFEAMLQEGVKPNKCILSCILKACGSVRMVVQGNLVHDKILRSGFESDLVIGSALIDMYAKSGSLAEAGKVFEELPHRNIVSWGAMIMGYTEHGHNLAALELFQRMEQEGMKANENIISCVLKVCALMEDITRGRMLHEMIIWNRFEIDVVVRSAILDMYSKCGSLEEACKVFNSLQSWNAVSWSVMIAGFTNHGCFSRALQLFQRMQEEGMQPIKATYLCALKACGSLKALEQGRLVHFQIVQNCQKHDVEVGSTLINMYAACSSLEEAHDVFDRLPTHDVVSWCAIIGGYVKHEQAFQAFELFKEMQEDGINPDTPMFSCILKACSSVAALEQGKLVHGQIIENGLESDLAIGNSLIDMYSKCGSLKQAQKVFDALCKRDMVSWGAMIAGYSDHGQGLCALEHFERMLDESLEPDQVIFLSALKACCNLMASGHGKYIHDQIMRHGYETDQGVGSTLIDMYAKSGNLQEAHKVFDGLPSRDIVSWGAMIAGCVQSGNGFSAFAHFDRMLQEGIKPNKVTLLCILLACTSTGALCQGKLVHEHIINKGLEHDVMIGNTILDMYAKCGSLEDAYKVFNNLPNRDSVSFGVMIRGYAQHGHCSLAMRLLEDMQRQGMKSHDMIFTVILSACSDAGLVEEGRLCFQSMMREHGMTPRSEHFVCMADLLGRAGHLEESKQLLQSMPSRPSIIGWTSLLTSCKKHGNMELGRNCFTEVSQLDPNLASGYVLMSNIYADTHTWQGVSEMQELRKSVGACKTPGKAWVEVNDVLHEFVVGDKHHAQNDQLYGYVRKLIKSKEDKGYLPQLELVFEPLFNQNLETAFCTL